MKGSIIIIAFFILGVFVGIFNLFPFQIAGSKISYYALCGLMFFVGMNIGSDSKTLRYFRSINPRFILLPIITIIGTLVGSAVVSLFFKHRSLADYLAVGSGMGYYSLSSIFITEYKGAELGTIALFSNIAREIITLLFAPIFVKYFGKLAPISAGGATSMDITLPIITRFSGNNFVIISILHGFILDLCVPFLVVLFCSL